MPGVTVASSRRTIIPIPLMVIMLTTHLFTPLVAADGMESCSGDASSDGYCDDYNHNHDYTQNHPDWINGTYDFTLLDTGTIELNMVWAIHEFDREKVGLNDAFSTTILEDQDNLDSDDGAPADLLRQNPVSYTHLRAHETS